MYTAISLLFLNDFEKLGNIELSFYLSTFITLVQCLIPWNLTSDIENDRRFIKNIYECSLEIKAWLIKLICEPKLNLIGLIVFITKIISEEN